MLFLTKTWFLKKLYWFERQLQRGRGREKEARGLERNRDRSSIYLFIPQMATTVRAGPGWSKSLCLISQMGTRAQVLGSSSTVLPCALTGNWMESRTAGSWTTALVECQRGRWQFNALCYGTSLIIWILKCVCVYTYICIIYIFHLFER